ncbi:MAG TPA: hypothetical protein VNV37_12555 [Solirubrobacteraceae bacterium]|jgi:hypothetical protein|nr:hypothetical protein [Solirubrobacteraceae bacterium]
MTRTRARPTTAAIAAIIAIAAALLLAPLPPSTATATATPSLHVPRDVTVGHLVTLVVRDYRPGSRVTFAAQAAAFRGSNTGAVRLGRESYRMPASGTLRVRVRWPEGFYVGCTAVGCPGPPTSWPNGERADVSASDVTGGQYAEAQTMVDR